jgi:hypothetical protein
MEKIEKLMQELTAEVKKQDGQIIVLLAVGDKFDSSVYASQNDVASLLATISATDKDFENAVIVSTLLCKVTPPANLIKTSI